MRQCTPFVVFFTCLILGLSITLLVHLQSSKLNHGLYTFLRTIYEPLVFRKPPLTDEEKKTSRDQLFLKYDGDVYDSRKVFGNQILGVQNQGACGSCVVFALLSLMSDQIALTHQQPAFALSVQYVLDCLSQSPSYIKDVVSIATKINPTVSKEKNLFPYITRYEMCTGNFEPVVAFYLRQSEQHGVVSETCFPYEYSVPYDFYLPFLRRLRLLLKYKTPVVVCLSLSLVFSLLFMVFHHTLKNPTQHTVAALIVYILCTLCLLLGTLFVFESYRVRDVLLAVQKQIVYHTVHVNRLVMRQSQNTMTCDIQTQKNTSPCFLSQCTGNTNEKPVKYFLKTFVHLSGSTSGQQTTHDVLKENHGGFLWPINTSYRSLTLEQKIRLLKSSIIQYRSIGVAFKLIPSFYTFSSDEDYRPPYAVDIDPETQDIRYRGGHVVSIVGYTETAWILRNQWGKEWGRMDDPGYIYWAFGALEFETQNEFFAVTV